jgi:hypothetical protein
MLQHPLSNLQKELSLVFGDKFRYRHNLPLSVKNTELKDCLLTFTLKMATAMFAETMERFQQTTQLKPERQYNALDQEYQPMACGPDVAISPSHMAPLT